MVALAIQAAAQSPLVAELETVATRYHEKPDRLDTLREGLAQAVTTDAPGQPHRACARLVHLGDFRAATPEQTLEAYDLGGARAR